jgi:hypothetical protein
MTTKDSKQSYNFSDAVSISEIMELTGRSRCWIHRAIVQNRIPEGSAKQIPMLNSEGNPILTSAGKPMVKWIMDRETALNYFGSEGNGRSKREDGKNRVAMLYGDVKTLPTEILDLLSEHGFVAEAPKKYRKAGSKAS